MTKAYPSRRTRWPLLLFLLVFHALLLLGLNHQRVDPEQRATAVILRILTPQLPPPPLALTPPMPRAVAFVPSPVFIPVPEVATAPNPNPSIAAATPSPPASAAVAASAPARLNLALPTQMMAGPHAPSAREQALSDPRANAPKITVEYNIADAAGTLPVTRSTSTDGMESTIVRQGRTRCTRISKPRGAVIDPMDSRSRDAPAMAGDCPHK